MKTLFLRLATSGVLGLAVWVGWLAVENYGMLTETRSKHAELVTRKQNLQVKIDQLKEEQQRILSNPVYFKQLVRENLLMVEEGEEVYIINPKP